jgi:hypothetical protein
VLPEDELRRLGTVSDHTGQVHCDALLDVDVGRAEDLGDGLGDRQEDAVAEYGSRGDLTLVQTAVRQLGRVRSSK